MCSSSRDCSSSVWSPSSRGTSSSRAVLAVCRRATNPATTRPSRTAVTRSNSTVAAAVIARTAASPRVDRISAARLDTRTMWIGGGDQHAGQGGERDLGDPARGHQHDHEQDQRMGQRRQPRGRPGTDVHRGSRDRGGRRDSAEQRGAQVGQSLTDELAVGVVALAHAHPVGHRGRQQALQGGQCCDGDRGQQEGIQIGEGDPGQVRGGEPGGDPADRRGTERERGVGHGGCDHGDQGDRQAGSDPCPDQDERRHGHRHAEGSPRGVQRPRPRWRPRPGRAPSRRGRPRPGRRAAAAAR